MSQNISFHHVRFNALKCQLFNNMCNAILFKVSSKNVMQMIITQLKISYVHTNYSIPIPTNYSSIETKRVPIETQISFPKNTQYTIFGISSHNKLLVVIVQISYLFWQNTTTTSHMLSTTCNNSIILSHTKFLIDLFVILGRALWHIHKSFALKQFVYWYGAFSCDFLIWFLYLLFLWIS